MPLFTDAPICGLSDLVSQDSQLLDVASIESISVTQKLALAQEDVGLTLLALLKGLEAADRPIWTNPTIGLDHVAVTPALKLWVVNRCLEFVYQDAYNSQLNDRYAGKRDQFHLLAQAASERLMQLGLAVVPNPVPQAPTPQLTAIPGSLPDGIYYVTTAWVDAFGEEGASAPPAVITLAASTFMVMAGNSPQCSVGWNVYAGKAPEAMYLQNVTLIACGQSWQPPGALVTSGKSPTNGQQPTYWKLLPRVLQRG